MIVDLLRNDLGRICRTGTIAVPDIFETRSFTNVHHLVSTITGQLRDAEDVFDLLKAGFPGGSITGTPKIRAMEIINELESVMRSVYCGAFLWIDISGNMDSNICIRTLVKDYDRIHCWGGGGVVADSQGDQEYQESLDKISLFMDALKSNF
jgi:para-aminobenzoate synthetase component 1